MKETGIVKFDCTWIKGEHLPNELIKEVNIWRNKLYSLGLIGVYDNGIGYGNISTRFHQNHFIISGSATGGIEVLDENHYAMVTDYEIEKNTLTAVGPIIASSESLSHAVIYEHSNKTNAVMHIHNPSMWKRLLNTIPTTRIDIPYGTPQMATEIVRLINETTVLKDKIFVMGGHEDGIIVFGNTLDEAGEVLLRHFKAEA